MMLLKHGKSALLCHLVVQMPTLVKRFLCASTVIVLANQFLRLGQCVHTLTSDSTARFSSSSPPVSVPAFHCIFVLIVAGLPQSCLQRSQKSLSISPLSLKPVRFAGSLFDAYR